MDFCCQIQVTFISLYLNLYIQRCHFFSEEEGKEERSSADSKRKQWTATRTSFVSQA